MKSKPHTHPHTHARATQGQRDKASKLFHDSTNVVLFTSDVTARGLDYPDVSFVCQVGITTKEQYIHRLGRTARAGKSGSGLLLLADFEQSHMNNELRGLPITGSPLQSQTQNLVASTLADNGFQQAQARSFDPQDELHKSVSQAYQAWLGFYNGYTRKLGWNNADLVQRANQMAAAWGYPNDPPPLQRKTVGKMGLKGVPGLNIDDSIDSGGGRGGGGGGKGGKGGGGKGGGKGGGGKGGKGNKGGW